MFLELSKVKTHNLKGFDLKIPLNQLVVITGPSGSGKSSLAFDTIARLIERKFNFYKNFSFFSSEDISVEAQISGTIPPVIALSQGVRDWYPYKCLYELLGLKQVLGYLFYERGKHQCPQCKNLNEIHSLSQVINWFENLPPLVRIYFLVPIREVSKGAISYLLSQGYTRFVVDDKELDLSEEPLPESFNKVYLLLDRFIKEEKALFRLLENLRLTQNLNRGFFCIKLLDESREIFFNLSPFCQFCGTYLERGFLKCKSCKGLGYKEKEVCKSCEGLKLEPQILESEIFGHSLKEILKKNLSEFEEFLKTNLSEKEKILFQGIFSLFEKARFLEVDYLKLSTPVFDLSLGERKLLELLSLFVENLKGVLYVLDEPTLGLDEKRRKKILELIREKIREGNSFIVVEHDLEFIKEADFIIELGPEGGEKGGYLLKALPKEEYLRDKEAFLYPYFERGPLFEKRLFEKKEFFEISLEGKIFKILKEGINLLYGDTGKGLSKELKALAQALREKGFKVYEGEEVLQLKGEKMLVDYLEIWEALREVLVLLPEAKVKGLTKRHFSFYTPEGQCKSCKGKGYKRIELEGVESKSLCEECLGKGLNYEVLNLTYKGYKVFEILDFTVNEALELFSQIYNVKEKLYFLKDLRLGYLKLSQKISQLSGGEKLRVDLVKRLTKREGLEVLVLFYPFQGLSIKDLEELSHFFRKLNKRGLTILMRETHPFASLMSDHLIV